MIMQLPLPEGGNIFGQQMPTSFQFTDLRIPRVVSYKVN